jgi:hypothetical protein
VVVWIFWGDAGSAGEGSFAGLGRWVLEVALAGGAAVAIALVTARLGPRWRWAVAGAAGTGVVVAAALIASVL